MLVLHMNPSGETNINTVAPSTRHVPTSQLDNAGSRLQQIVQQVECTSYSSYLNT